MIKTIIVIKLLSLIILGLSLWWMHKEVNFFRCFSIPQVFFIFYLLLIYIGSFRFFLVSGYLSIKYIAAVNFVLLLIPFGITIANFIFKFDSKEILMYNKQPIIDDIKDFTFFIPFFLLFAFSLALFITYLHKLKVIPLFALFNNKYTTQDLLNFRFAATQGFSGSGYLYAIPAYTLFPLLSFIALAKYLASRKKYWILIFIFLFLLTSFANLVNIQKMPIALYIFGLFILWTIAHGAIDYKKALIIMIKLLIILLIVIYFYNRMSSSLSKGLLISLRGIYERICFGQTWVLYNYFKIFPKIHPFVHGKSIGHLCKIMGWEHFPVSHYVHNYMNPENAGKGGANTCFIGNMYADFGYIIMLLSMIVVGFIMQLCQIFFTRKRKEPLNLALLSFLCISFSKLSHTNFFVTLSTFGTIWSIVAIIALKFSYKGLKKLKIFNG